GQPAFPGLERRREPSGIEWLERPLDDLEEALAHATSERRRERSLARRRQGPLGLRRQRGQLVEHALAERESTRGAVAYLQLQGARMQARQGVLVQQRLPGRGQREDVA